MSDIWALVHAERQALIADLAHLTPEQWEAPSLCGGWTVRDVAAHLVDNARTTTPRLFLAMARAGFDLDRQNDNGVAAERGATPADTLAALRAVADRRSTPPAPLASRLVEEIAHGEDIRRPLGLARPYPPQAVAPAIAYQLKTPDRLGGAKSLTRRVRLMATDLDLTLGDGPDLRGPALELLMIASRRPHRTADLSGEGVSAL